MGFGAFDPLQTGPYAATLAAALAQHSTAVTTESHFELIENNGDDGGVELNVEELVCVYICNDVCWGVYLKVGSGNKKGKTRVACSCLEQERE